MMTRTQLKLLLLLAVFAAPALAAWLVYAWWQPSRLGNYGELLPPQPLVLPALLDPTGQTTPWTALRGKWVLLVVAPGNCDGACAHAAYLARQARLAQGREQERIERVLLGSSGDMAWPHRDGAYRALLGQPGNPLAQPGGALAQGGLFLVDPLGNLMMRFPDKADGKGVIRDLRQLLKASRIG